mmetsp:Transcript_38662/g.28543  ORF Transcript_38662/g.28543 Transcript_38662/m.28543 type:complete len:95 (-) Transcript_38662:91-375(-)
MFIENNDVAFILDMDSDFIMVPTVWVNKLLLARLMQLTVSLSNILKMKVMKKDSYLNYEEEEKKGSHVAASKLEKRIEVTSHSIKIMERVNKVI